MLFLSLALVTSSKVALGCGFVNGFFLKLVDVSFLEIAFYKKNYFAEISFKTIPFEVAFA